MSTVDCQLGDVNAPAAQGTRSVSGTPTPRGNGTTREISGLLVRHHCNPLLIWDNSDTASEVPIYGKHLNANLKGDLTPVFESLGGFGQLHQYFDQDRHLTKYEAYREFLVQVFADAQHGDVGEAMFANALLEVTLPNVVLNMIAPDIGPQGKLNGILGGKHGDVAKHIQRQPQQGHIGPPNFIECVRYLKDGKDRGFATQANAEVIVDHMFRTDPGRAFTAMLWADYGFNPHARDNCHLFCREDTQAVRDLQLAHIRICAFLSRRRYSFPVREEQITAVRTDLRRFTEHEKWWVRLYVTYLITQERQLRNPELVEKLMGDGSEIVQAAMSRLAKESHQRKEEDRTNPFT